MPLGSWARVALMAACTLLAALSMFWSRSSCRVMRVLPRELEEVSSVTPAMVPRARSRGVATVAAMVSGLAPGRLAETVRVGKSTWGRAATGSRR
jgi:hypothetical protein